ncbi:MAG: ParB/RepB/Spo0J family partition protein [Candidatus Krumholzibacteria bacterium]|nr:ParB/RepB/Spo0J family partition protein [Candidatus Krumholzibacteria bacterium]
MTKKVLGRGIEALISQDLRESVSETERVKELEIDRIDPNPHQPRTHFDSDHLRELAESIKLNGVLQPVVVRRVGDRYQLILGERRHRAAKLAGKATIPAIVREVNDAESLKHALMENLQREDLNPIEEARGLQALKDGFGLSVNDIASMIGKNRSTIANSLRLLGLPEIVMALIVEGKLTAGHARALLSIDGEEAQIEWARKIVSEGLTVREIEHPEPGAPRAKRRRGPRRLSTQAQAIEEALERHLGTRAKITPRNKGGVIWIEYYSDEELERILEKMGIGLQL